MTQQKDSIYLAWLDAKAAEQSAIVVRRTLEDKMLAQLTIDAAQEGATTIERDGYVVKVTGRIDRKVDSEKLQELAAEHGLTDHLPSLFRWKPEINMAVWKASADNITKPLSGAITAKPGRPSFNIVKKED